MNGARSSCGPSCFACRAASQKAEMMMSSSPTHLLVWANCLPAIQAQTQLGVLLASMLIGALPRLGRGRLHQWNDPHGRGRRQCLYAERAVHRARKGLGVVDSAQVAD